MPRRKVILGMLALVPCGILAVLFWPEKPEPVYEGRKLSQWVQGTARKGMFTRPDPNPIEVIGTNGIPYYLQWIRYRPGILKKAELQLAAKSRKWFHFKWTAGDTGAMRAW